MYYQATKGERELSKKSWRKLWFCLERNALSYYKCV